MGSAGHRTKNPAGWPRVPRSGAGRRILFINPPSIPYNVLIRTFEKSIAPLHQTVSMPMGILYLAATLERDLPGIAINIVDLAKRYRELCDHNRLNYDSFESFCDDTLRSEIKDVPDLIGLSVLFSTAHKSTLRIAEVCKSIWPQTLVVVGGMHAAKAVKSLLEHPAVDFVCRGEGEAIIADVATEISSAIPGIIDRENADTTGSAPFIYDLDTIPHPAWHLLNMNEYVFGATAHVRNLENIEQDGAATIVTNRGCPFFCTFCASWTVHGREMRYRSKENVLEELKMLTERYGVNTVVPVDDLFSVKKPRFIELCNAISAEFNNRLHFQFPNGLSVATLDAEVISAMKRMGMAVANVAIESGSDHVQRKIIKKNVNLRRAREVVSECRRQGIIVRVYFILGFPGETKEQMQETVDFATSLEADWALIHPAAPLAGTEMFDQLIARGDIDSSFNWDEAFYLERCYDTAEISAEELKEFAFRANLQINFFENYNLRSGNFRRAEALFRTVLCMYPGHLAAHLCLARALSGQGKITDAETTLRRAREMIEDEEPMAVEQLAMYPDLFPELVPGGYVPTQHAEQSVQPELLA